jgi:hypothetical protein
VKVWLPTETYKSIALINKSRVDRSTKLATNCFFDRSQLHSCNPLLTLNPRATCPLSEKLPNDFGFRKTKYLGDQKWWANPRGLRVWIEMPEHEGKKQSCQPNVLAGLRTRELAWRRRRRRRKKNQPNPLRLFFPRAAKPVPALLQQCK